LIPTALLWLLPGVELGAQNRPATYTEYRGDVIVGRGTSAQVGGGIYVPMGYYLRVGVIGAAGSTWREHETVTSGRVDLIARYLIDPFREIEWAPSFGAGLSVHSVDGDRVRAYLVMALDIEGPRVIDRRLSPAFQIGLGGGARFAIAVRTSRGPWR
jgi:hypothetical protein